MSATLSPPVSRLDDAARRPFVPAERADELCKVAGMASWLCCSPLSITEWRGDSSFLCSLAGPQLPSPEISATFTKTAVQHLCAMRRHDYLN
jgi:hypothetical protein